jgi:hypothetical protein
MTSYSACIEFVTSCCTDVGKARKRVDDEPAHGNDSRMGSHGPCCLLLEIVGHSCSKHMVIVICMVVGCLGRPHGNDIVFHAIAPPGNDLMRG